jgi:hypothetical protein
LGATVALAGATLTLSDPVTAAGIVIFAEANFDPSATEVAVRVTMRAVAGAVPGAV